MNSSSTPPTSTTTDTAVRTDTSDSIEPTNQYSYNSHPLGVTASQNRNTESFGIHQSSTSNQIAQPHAIPPPIAMRAISPQRPLPTDQHAGISNSPPSSMSIAVSPGRIRSSSPRLHSPASSLIFERNVQEQTVPEDLSHKLPAHIQTEDHIPAVLEASSIAITDDHLKPDDVEILTHSVHQPAMATVPGSSGLDSGAISPQDEAHPTTLPLPTEAADDRESTYGSIDPTDVRRLSFISFADVVQGEHAAEHNIRESVLHMSLSESAANRSPSPSARSPISMQGFGGPSPPTSGAPSVTGLDQLGMSKMPLSPGSPLSLGQQSPPLVGGPASPSAIGGGEVMVEKMSEALRKTGSGDLLGSSGAVPHSVHNANLSEGNGVR